MAKKRMSRKNQQPWQFKLTMALSMLMLFLVFGYFYQSFLEIRKVKPVVVAIEKIKDNNVSKSDVVINEDR
jgi:hypothetical protein